MAILEIKPGEYLFFSIPVTYSRSFRLTEIPGNRHTSGMQHEHSQPGCREWITVVLGCIVTFFFSYFFYGWAAMQALFEMDGVYEEVCPMEDSLCSQRGSRMVLLFSVDNTVSILSGSLDIVSQVVFLSAM